MELEFRRKTLERARENAGSPEARILEAARRLFARQGYKGTTTRQIVDTAGVNIATLHYFWGSKEELWNAVHFEVQEELQAYTAGLLQEVSSMEPHAAFREAVFRFYSMLISNPDLTMLREKARGTDMERHYEEEDLATFNLIAAYFEGSREYDFSPVGSRYAVACFFGAIGYFLQPTLISNTFGIDADEPDEEFRRAVAEAVCTMMDRFGRFDG